MRAMWCTLIALCLVAAGAQPHRIQRSPDSTPTLRVAAAGSPAAVRRATSPDVGPCLPAAPVVASAPVRQLVSLELVARNEATSSQLRSPRLSRGPPHA